MDSQVFADGVGGIAIIGGTVRFDLVRLSATELDESGKPKAEFVQRVVMPAENFLGSVEKMQGAAQALTKLIAAAKAQLPAQPEQGPHTAADTQASAPANPAKRPFP